MRSDEDIAGVMGSASPSGRSSPAGPWIAFALILAVLLSFAAFIVYQRYLREPSRNVIKVNVDHGQIRHVFYLDRGYLKDPDVPPREHIVIYAAYPSMLPCARNDVPGNSCMHILIAPDRKKTNGEFIVEEWRLRKDRPDNGPRFDKYIGEEDGYQVYEGIINSKANDIVRTRIFLDNSGNLVSDGYYADARFLSGIPVRYGAAKGYQTTPMEMHRWMGNLLIKLTQEAK